MSGDSTFTILRKIVEKSAKDTEILINQLHDLRMPKPPSRPDELAAIVAAYNKSHEKLSSQFKSLKDLIEQYREANFVRFSGGFHVGASIPSNATFELPKFEPGEDPLRSVIKYGSELVINFLIYELRNNKVLRAHITHDWLPELFNRRRNQDDVSDILKGALNILGRVLEADLKLVAELVFQVLTAFANFVKEFALDVEMTLADWFGKAIDLLALTLRFIGEKAAELAGTIGEQAEEFARWILPELGAFLQTNADSCVILATALLFAVLNRLESMGYKFDVNGDLEKDKPN
jgi:hypothetical protein